MLTTSENDLIKACNILFGSDIASGRDFLYYIQHSGIKTAYRKRARLTHPDTANCEESRLDLTEQFIETNRAYEQLLDFVSNRDRTVPRHDIGSPAFRREARHGGRNRNSHGHAHAARQTTAPHSGRFHEGPVPRRKLLFGQYLYYTREVSWESLIHALIWQRRQRPRLGDLALQSGLLSDVQLKFLLNSRLLGERIGEAAIRHRYIDRLQLQWLLSRQRFLQLPFGEYFVRKELMTRAKLFRSLHEFMRHNLGFQTHP